MKEVNSKFLKENTTEIIGKKLKKKLDFRN